MKLLAACTALVCMMPVKVSLQCTDISESVEYLKMAKVRSQELYSIDDPERFQDDREKIDALLKKLNESYDKNCKKE